jgi:hypothetical protein
LEVRRSTGQPSGLWGAGKPDKAAAEALRAAGGKAPGGAVAPLSTDLVDTLPAMRFVVSQPDSADTTHQQKAMRQWLQTSPTTFFNRLADLEKAELSSRPAAGSPPADGSVKWNGRSGVCPACDRPPGDVDAPLPADAADETILDLLTDEDPELVWGLRLVEAAKAKGEKLPAELCRIP